MNALQRISRLRRTRFELFGDTLSGRVLWFTVLVILVIEVAVLLPGLGRERQDWLSERITHAHLVIYALANAGAAPLTQAQTETLLDFAGVEAITLTMPGQPPLHLQTAQALPPLDRHIQLTNETLLYSTWRAMLRVAGFGGHYMDVTGSSPLEPGAVISAVVNETTLNNILRQYAIHEFMITIIVALVTGLLIFTVLDRLLVRPMRIITASIINFREDPEHEEESDLSWLAGRRGNEVSGAARELKVMQEQLRAALWRNARLAAVGTSVAKISHDLRNILSSALLVADRLQTVNDPVVQRATRTLIPAVEHAAQLVTRTVDFAREGPPPIIRSAVDLHGLVEESVSVICPDDDGVVVENLVPENLILALDRAQIYRVLVNLMRNAAEAGAQTIKVSTMTQNGITRMRVADDGPGLPLRVQDNLFKPFTTSGKYGGTGLGLAIARDLIRAHGGDLVLERTGPRGTVFSMELAISDTQI
ncbi:MAG: HAMP domain-containing sensor histidine kinase [Acidocella sp.]|nr:HAMP domain-containing sensor histidine kinase [Acidocella sp.]